MPESTPSTGSSPSRATRAATAGGLPNPAILDAFPFLASLAIASERGTGGAPDLILAGAGGGVIPYQHTPTCSTPPCAFTEMSAPFARFDSTGLVRDLAIGSRYVYVAAWHAGLLLCDRQASLATFGVAGASGARCVSAIDLDAATSVIAVGTARPDDVAHALAGELIVFALDRTSPLGPNNPKLVASASFDAPVVTVAASARLPFGVLAGESKFSVLVGTECATSNGVPAPLSRFDFAYSGGASARLARRFDWNGDPQGSKTLGRFVRKLAIDDAHLRAYAAAYWDGVYAFDLAAGLVRDLGSAWPIRSTQPSYANALALDPAPEAGVRARLIVGRGLPKQAESQYLGDCADLPRNDADRPPEVLHSARVLYGFATYVLDANDQPSTGVEVQRQTTSSALAPHALAVRRVDDSSYLIDIADDVGGLFVWRATRSISPTQTPIWVLPTTPEATVGVGLGPKLPLHAMDDVAVVDDAVSGERALYASTELGLATFDLTNSSASLAASYVSFASPPGAINLATSPSPGARVFASTSAGHPTHPGGLGFFDATEPLAPVAIRIELDKGGFGYGLCVVDGVVDASKSPSLRRWLYSVQEAKPAGQPLAFAWSVKGWDVGSPTAPIDPDANPALGPQSIGSFDTQSVAATGLMKLEALTVAAPATPTPTFHALYALFAPRLKLVTHPVAAGGATVGPAGLLVLRASLPPAANAFTFVAAIPAWTDADSGFAGARALFDAATERVYAAWATGGIAAFDVSNRLAPSLVAALKLDQRAGDGLKHAPIQVLPGPIGASGTRYLYVGFLNEGIAIYSLVPNSPSFSPPERFELAAGPFATRFQTTALALDPSDPSKRTLYTAQARAGIDRLRFDPSLFP